MDVISVDGEKNKRSACVDEIGMFWLRAFACFPLSAFCFSLLYLLCAGYFVGFPSGMVCLARHLFPQCLFSAWCVF